jgi:hypothetical protein
LWVRPVAVAVILTLASAPAHADWWSWLFGPKDYEDCAESAARDAKSKEALNVLLFSCNSKFPGRRKPIGGYTFFDSRQNRYFDIAGPNPTSAELAIMEGQYTDYVAIQAENARLQQEEARKRQIEQDRLSAIRELELQQEAAARQRETQRQVAIAQIAHAELQKRQQIASRRVAITSTSIECTFSMICGRYKLTVGIKNQSGETLSVISLGWVFMPKDEHLDCPTSMSTMRQLQVKLAPNDTTVMNIDGYDGPSSTQFRYCVGITSVEIVAQN